MEDHRVPYILKDILEGAGLRDVADKLKGITKEEALEDYKALVDLGCSINPKSHVGNKAMDFYFFKHRLATKAKGGESFYDWFKKPLTTPSSKRLYKYNIDHGKSPAVAKYDVFRLYKGSINAFKPIVAKELYCRYKPKTILDFSAGWGGRCLGAMSLDINYIGFDTNKSLKKAYGDMIRTYPHTSKVSLHFQDSAKVDYSKYTYDFVFTSPPYFQKTKPTEEYEGMPHYASREEFNEKFFFPVVEKTWKHLQRGGHYALNIPIDMYDDVKKVLGACSKKFPLQLQKRYSGQEGGYKEFIYVWNK
jgi:hypothetical protein